MSEYKLLLPSMGEGVMEATIISWLYKEGEDVKEDDSVVEIATDKVDSDVPTPVSGKIIRILKQKDEVAKVGEAIAILETDAQAQIQDTQIPASIATELPSQPLKEIEELQKTLKIDTTDNPAGKSYFSPLVKTIAEKENISEEELGNIPGTGLEGRVTKEDILKYLESRTPPKPLPTETPLPPAAAPAIQNTTNTADGDEVIPMDRVRKIIAEAMVNSKKTAPHVTSFIETDVTRLVNWRNKHKASFEKREGEKLTYMPIFIRAVVKAIQDYPMINISVEGDKIIKKKNINIGIATAMPDGNLIVPVIRNADRLSLSGLAKAINDLAARARNKKLKPDETQGATYTISNIGSFGNLMGTPIIPQPQVAILAVGAIVKKPAVLETENGDVIAIRSQMYMSHSYDHRVVDGALGGMFLKRVHDYLQEWDTVTEI